MGGHGGHGVQLHILVFSIIGIEIHENIKNRKKVLVVSNDFFKFYIQNYIDIRNSAYGSLENSFKLFHDLADFLCKNLTNLIPL